MSLEPSESSPAVVAALHRSGSRLNHAVYDQLKERLLDGRYAAGERISTEALRTEFGVSKQPVMEALRRLSGDGLIEILPQVGSRVATFTPREVSDFYVMFAGDQNTARAEMEKHIVGTVDVIRAEADAAGRSSSSP